ncbi:MAG: hypothetical protein ABIT37_01220 [Luteolibacter sp.]
MQRWIVVGVIAMAMVFGGGLFAFRTYKQNLPYPVWVPLPINPELSTERQDAIAKDLKAKLLDHRILVQVSKDVGLKSEWQLASDEQCADELAKRLFIRLGDTNTKMGRVPTVNVGVNGKTKERGVSEKVAVRLIKDVYKILGIDPPPAK